MGILCEGQYLKPSSRPIKKSRRPNIYRNSWSYYLEKYNISKRHCFKNISGHEASSPNILISSSVQRSVRVESIHFDAKLLITYSKSHLYSVSTLKSHLSVPSIPKEFRNKRKGFVYCFAIRAFLFRLIPNGISSCSFERFPLKIVWNLFSWSYSLKKVKNRFITKTHASSRITETTRARKRKESLKL